MSGHSPETIKKEVRIYLAVFAILAVLTVLTVGVSYLKLTLGLAIVVALAIASVKGSLVAGFFMHLRMEKRVIWALLLLVAFFFIFLLLYPSWHFQ